MKKLIFSLWSWSYGEEVGNSMGEKKMILSPTTGIPPLPQFSMEGQR